MKRGQTLVLVLWIMGILTVAMGVLVVRSTHELRLGSMPLQTVQRNGLAQAGVSQAAGLLKQDDPALDHLGDSWATGIDAQSQQRLKNVRAGEGTFSVSIEDEQRKLNLNKASASALTRLIQQLLPDAPAAELAAAIVDWRDEPVGDACRAAAVACHNGPFDSVDELRLVPAMSPAWFDVLVAYVTVYGDGTVNVNTAPAVVLNAVGGSGEAWVEQRKQQPFTSSPDSGNPTLGVSSTHFTVSVAARLSEDQSPARVQAVIDRKGHILAWHPQQ